MCFKNVKTSDLCLQFQHPLPRLSQFCLGLSLTQPHAHELVLQLTQGILLGTVLPATGGACQVTLKISFPVSLNESTAINLFTFTDIGIRNLRGKKDRQRRC